ncbi:MAG: hypothetical protein ACXWQX_09145 [Bdellovibrio sp.]
MGPVLSSYGDVAGKLQGFLRTPVGAGAFTNAKAQRILHNPFNAS